MKTVLGLFLLALSIRLGVIYTWQFDGLYGQDAFAYFDQARAIVEKLPRGELPPADFFWPNGFPLLVALLMAVLGPIPLAGQAAALLSGALLAPLAYLLGRDLFVEDDQARPEVAESAGLIAGLIVAVAGQPILSSVVVMADMPALAWATLATWGTVRGMGTNLSPQPPPRNWEGEKRQKASAPSSAWFLAAGMAIGLAVISRWLYALAAPALGLYVLLRLRLDWRAGWRPALATLAGLLIVTPQLWLSLHRPEGLAHSWLVGWSPAHFFQRRFENVDGIFVYPLPNAVFYAQPAGHPAFIFPLLGLAAGWAIWRLVRQRQWSLLALLLGWAGPVYLFLAGIPYQNFRFGLSLYLPLALLTGYGLADLILNSKFKTHNLKFLFILSLLATLAWAYPMLDSFLTVQNRSKTITRQVEQVVPPEATLLTFGLTLTAQHYTKLPVLELFNLDEASLATLVETTAPLYLLIDPGNINSQWRGRAPEVAYRWLREHTRLIERASFPPYILYRVELPGEP